MRRVARRILAAMFFVMLPAVAAEYPDHPVRMIVPFTPAGATDMLARLVGERLGAKLGQSVVIDNRAGAGGNVGAEIAARAAPDGYTLLMGPASIYAISATLYPRLGYDLVEGSHPGFAGCQRAACAAGQQRSAGEVGARAHSVCEEEAGGAQYCFTGQRHCFAPGGRTAQAYGGNRNAARALPRQRAGDPRSDRRPGTCDVRQHCLRASAHPRRKAARDRSGIEHALVTSAEHADSGGIGFPVTAHIPGSAFSCRPARRNPSSSACSAISSPQLTNRRRRRAWSRLDSNRRAAPRRISRNWCGTKWKSGARW